MNEILYPTWMQHPNVRRPYIDRQNQLNNRGIVLGPIQVHSEDQRLMYEAQGYEVCKVPSPGQYEPEFGSGPQIKHGQPHQEYPKWITPSVLVNSAEEEAAWRATQALAPVEQPAAPPAAKKPRGKYKPRKPKLRLVEDAA